jgi:VWFA-related protein
MISRMMLQVQRAKSLRILPFGFAIILIAVLACAQTLPDDEIRWGARPYAPTPENAIRVQTNMVEVGVVLRDSHGKTVGGLTQSDFQVFDNGKLQKTTFFSVETAPQSLTIASAPPPADNPALPPAPTPKPRPRLIAFYFDDFSMPEGDLAFSRRAADQFVRESLEPGDRIGVFTSSTFVFLDFTDDRSRLLAALGQLVTHQKRSDRGPMTLLAPPSE